jgi:hypothetical protein
MSFTERCQTNTHQINLPNPISWTRYYYISSFSLSKNPQEDPLLKVYSSLLLAGIPALWKLAEYTHLSANTGRPTRLFSSNNNITNSPGNSLTPGKRRTSSRLNQKRKSQVGECSSPTISEHVDIPDEKRIYCRELWIFEYGNIPLKKCSFPGLARMQGTRFIFDWGRAGERIV